MHALIVVTIKKHFIKAAKNFVFIGLQVISG
jgi:hypothetical protein